MHMHTHIINFLKIPPEYSVQYFRLMQSQPLDRFMLMMNKFVNYKNKQQQNEKKKFFLGALSTKCSILLFIGNIIIDT